MHRACDGDSVKTERERDLSGFGNFSCGNQCERCCRGTENQQGVEKGQGEAFEDVQLGPLLGQGGFGKVYRGLWNGAAVAVKVGAPFTALLAYCVMLASALCSAFPLYVLKGQ